MSVAVAEAHFGEVINCDSLQVYRHFDIGTAKITPTEQHGIPHHLIDAVEPDKVFTAGDYARLGRAALDTISLRHHLPVVAGGTGFYLRALLEGLFEGPPRNEALRVRLQAREARRPGSLHRLLKRWDPAAAARIHANDVNKITRALEVILSERQSLTGLFERGRDPLRGYRILELGLNPPRAELYSRLERRARAMFEGGLVEEVRGLLARFPATCKPFESLGYAQAVAYLEGRLSLDQAIADTQMFTRRYAKRQWTWFRKEAGIEWLDGFGDEPAMQAKAVQRVADFLATV